jgi:hypothetical protein
VAHWTQAPAAPQTGVPFGQSAFWRQATQSPAAPQNLPGCAAQSVLARHWTQLALAVSQTGVVPEHCVLSVQPVTQT